MKRNYLQWSSMNHIEIIYEFFIPQPSFCKLQKRAIDCYISLNSISKLTRNNSVQLLKIALCATSFLANGWKLTKIGWLAITSSPLPGQTPCPSYRNSTKIHENYVLAIYTAAKRITFQTMSSL